MLTGARQVGKTTLLRQYPGQGGRAYVTLDDPLVLSLAKTDPALFMQRFPPPVLIDEIQYASPHELLPYIKMAADRAGEPGLFWLTGSQQFHLHLHAMPPVSCTASHGVKGCRSGIAGRPRPFWSACWVSSRRELSGQGLDASPFVPTPEEIARRTARRAISSR